MTLHKSVAFLASLIVLATLIACGSSDPEDLTFDLIIDSRSLNSDLVKVKQNDTVTLNFGTDEPGSVHLHGYDIEQGVAIGELTNIQFVANATGDFKITFHPAEIDVKTHGAVFESRTLEQGDIFLFKIHAGLTGETIPFHNHMDHEHIGSIEVSEDAPISGGAIIAINADGSFEPTNVTVRPGMTLTWTSPGSASARVASGEPAAVADESEHEEEEEHQQEGEGEELPLGSLEVHPR
jgi:plastocyanin